MGLAGDHQLLNASLAVAMVRAWEQHHFSSSSSIVQDKNGRAEGQEAPQQQQQHGLADAAARLEQLQQGVLPYVYCEGLGSARWPGRSQVCGTVAWCLLLCQAMSYDVVCTSLVCALLFCPMTQLLVCSWFRFAVGRGVYCTYNSLHVSSQLTELSNLVQVS